MVVRRPVSVRGAIMVGGQRIQVGLPHSRNTADITVEAVTYQITMAPPAVKSNGSTHRTTSRGT
jgi:hypothetical protein